MTDCKPCPFCGCKDIDTEIIFHEEDDSEYVVFSKVCSNCRCQTPYFTEAEEAIELWNRRADSEMRDLFADRMRELGIEVGGC